MNTSCIYFSFYTFSKECDEGGGCRYDLTLNHRQGCCVCLRCVEKKSTKNVMAPCELRVSMRQRKIQQKKLNSQNDACTNSFKTPWRRVKGCYTYFPLHMVKRNNCIHRVQTFLMACHLSLKLSLFYYTIFGSFLY